MNTKTVLACTAVIVAFALIVAPLAISEDALAKKKHGNRNRASQVFDNINPVIKAVNLSVAAAISYLVTM